MRKLPRIFAMDVMTSSLPTGERVSVSRHGGQVVSWQDATGRELLYLSPLCPLGGPAPIRGGVPVCFPQFASRGPLARHGFARTSMWTPVPDSSPGVVRMRLADDEASRAAWPHRFELELLARVQRGSLLVQLTVRNTGTSTWSFTGALHTYLRTTDVATVVLSGLAAHEFEDALAGGAMCRDAGPDLSRPIDRVYGHASEPLLLREGGSALRIEQQGFEDVVVWNPGPEGGSRPADLPPGDHRHMLCVEAAQVVAPIALKPGQTWLGSQALRQA